MKWNFSGQGYGVFEYFSNPQFKEIIEYIKKETPKLKSIRRKNEFREKCLRFAEYVIEKKYKNPPIFKQENWEAALKTWVKHYFFKEKTKYGICPVIFEQNDKYLLELTYKAEDFFEKKEKELKKIKHLKEKNEISNNCINDNKCKRSCEKYNEWIISMKKEFEGKQVFILNNSNKEFTKLKDKKTLSDLLKSDTFEEIPNCSYREAAVNAEPVSEEKEEAPVVKPKGAPKEQIMSSAGEDGQSMEAGVPSERNDQMPQETCTSHSDQVQREKESLHEGPHKDTETNSGENAQYEPESMLQIPGDSETTVKGNVISPQEKPLTDVHATTFKPAALSIPNLPSVTSDILKKPGLFKKKKKIKRREVKFLRILVPSYYKRSKFLRQSHLEHPINEEEEIIKKIKIQEHNMNKNENVSYGKKDRSITIIEVHMEILEECRNKEWEYNKGEFLAICQEVLTKKENRTYTNLKDDEVVMDNIKSTNEIEKQKSLWSKWVERHKICLEKLRKKDWFNNLKNDWKEERSYIKNSEKLRKYLSNENEKDPFLERKKDIWRHWVSRKGTIVEKYLEEELFEKLTEEIYNMLDTYENEGRKDDILFMNKEELENKENYEVLCKYFKTKLLEKLCILVFMMVLEECKNEEYIENMESHFDNSINECITGKNLDIKPEIEENLTDINGDVLGNIKNNKNYTYEGEDCFREELKEWIRENDAYINSLDSDNNIDECYQVVE
ncbi:hypothetical protein MKS88_003983 [Plasmodium brasilianum]|uniref:Uncharacterized protein n=1 Tax=Plasmodium brasilianum TaxID=5824 RepID=A0ACB9Y8H0_PLABR|nr:hypothetical protein MKS88_003983 [Plasmodium brasilianum]